MTPFRIIAVLLLGGLFVTGCGKKSDDAPFTLETFASEAADTMCAALVKCSCTDASALEDCKIAYRELTTLTYSQVLFRQPGVKLDPAAARECLNEMRNAVDGCPSPTWGESGNVTSQGIPFLQYLSGETCSKVFVGSQTEGEHCTDTSTCVKGTWCDQATMTCVVQGAIAGSTCSGRSQDRDVACKEGLYCTDGHVCAPLPGSEENCLGLPCQEGLSCVYADATYKCKAPHALDEECGDGAGCMVGAFCDESTSTCKAYLADGATCDSSVQCLHAYCFESKCVDPGFCSSPRGPI
jgi:hypothetical protein